MNKYEEDMNLMLEALDSIDLLQEAIVAQEQQEYNEMKKDKEKQVGPSTRGSAASKPKPKPNKGKKREASNQTQQQQNEEEQIMEQMVNVYKGLRRK